MLAGALAGTGFVAANCGEARHERGVVLEADGRRWTVSVVGQWLAGGRMKGENINFSLIGRD